MNDKYSWKIPFWITLCHTEHLIDGTIGHVDITIHFN